MRRSRPSRWRRWLVLGVSLSSLATGCSTINEGASAREGAGQAAEIQLDRVTIFAPDVQDDLQRVKHAFAQFEDDTDYTVQVMGHRDFEDRIDQMVEGGNPPDIALFPQPGKVRDLAEEVVPLSRDTLSDEDVTEIEDDIPSEWREPVTVGSELLAVPIKADLKSLVWYDPASFERNHYEVPETFDEFLALAEEMARDGNTPFCLGLGSEFATGWPLTDWIEEFLLRRVGPNLYDQWVMHEIRFDDPRVVAVATEVYDLLSRPGFVYEGLESSPARPQPDAGDPLTRGDCMMYRMSNYYAVDWPEGTNLVGPDREVDTFFLPGSTEHPNVALTGGMYAAAFSDDPAVMAAMAHIAGPEYAAAGATYASSGEDSVVSGFLTPHRSVTTARYSELEQEFHEVLTDENIVRRFDASDLMPGAVGSNTFWRAAVLIARGEMTVEEAFAEIERGWPPDRPLETRPGDTVG